MPILSELAYRFNASQSPRGLSVGIDELILRFLWLYREPRTGQQHWGRKEGSRRVNTARFRDASYSRSNQTTVAGVKTRTRVDGPEPGNRSARGRPPSTGAEPGQCRKGSPSRRRCRKSWTHTERTLAHFSSHVQKLTQKFVSKTKSF